jgi:gamma-glutamylputrescine oxidase
LAKKSRLVNQNWWITTLLVNEHRHCPPLTRDIQCDVAIVGGGFAGVAAAIEFLKSGHKVVLLDKNIIGGSSSGRSAGFLTPDSELELHQLVRRYGVKAAGEIWQAPLRGIERLVASIQKHDIQCGLLKQDSLFLGLGKGGKEAVDSELHCRQEVGFTDQKTYDERQLKGILGAQGFSAGIRYGGTYGINPLACLQGFKNLLVEHGMQIFESTEMERLEDHTVYTHAGSVTADKIIIAVDKLEESISPYSNEVFHAQTFLSITEPLTDRELRVLFPSGEQMQCWDSKLVYTYFRLTADNRLLLGGGTPITTYMRDAYNNPRIIRKIINEFLGAFSRTEGTCRSCNSGRVRSMRPAICCPRSQSLRDNRTFVSSSVPSAFRGRHSPAASPRATSSASPTRTTRSTSITSPTNASSPCRAASASSSANRCCSP